MHYHVSDPTANQAIARADRELERMQKWANSIRERKMEGRLSEDALEKARKHFIGIYRMLLLEALNE
ncbi:MAG: hypothetical protein IKJ74_05585 [Clostridia bacterium]|nr:hypothetical protein [Clostridia bacterium]